VGCEGVGPQGEGFDGGEEDGVFGFLCREGGGGESEESEEEGLEELHSAMLVWMIRNACFSKFDFRKCL